MTTPAKKPYYIPKRTPTGGQRLQVWLNTDLQAALTEHAAATGTTMSAVARLILADWAAHFGQPPDYR